MLSFNLAAAGGREVVSRPPSPPPADATAAIADAAAAPQPPLPPSRPTEWTLALRILRASGVRIAGVAGADADASMYVHYRLTGAASVVAPVVGETQMVPASERPAFLHERKESVVTTLHDGAFRGFVSSQSVHLELWLVPTLAARTNLFDHVLLGTASASLEGAEGGAQLRCPLHVAGSFGGPSADVGELRVAAAFCKGGACTTPLDLPPTPLKGVLNPPPAADDDAGAITTAPPTPQPAAATAPPTPLPTAPSRAVLTIERAILPLAEGTAARNGARYQLRVLLPGGAPYVESVPFGGDGAPPAGAAALLGLECAPLSTLDQAELQLRRLDDDAPLGDPTSALVGACFVSLRVSREMPSLGGSRVHALLRTDGAQPVADGALRVSVAAATDDDGEDGFPPTPLSAREKYHPAADVGELSSSGGGVALAAALAAAADEGVVLDLAHAGTAAAAAVEPAPELLTQLPSSYELTTSLEVAGATGDLISSLSLDLDSVMGSLRSRLERVEDDDREAEAVAEAVAEAPPPAEVEVEAAAVAGPLLAVAAAAAAEAAAEAAAAIARGRACIGAAADVSSSQEDFVVVAPTEEEAVAGPSDDAPPTGGIPTPPSDDVMSPWASPLGSPPGSPRAGGAAGADSPAFGIRLSKPMRFAAESGSLAPRGENVHLNAPPQKSSRGATLAALTATKTRRIARILGTSDGEALSSEDMSDMD